MPSGDEAMDSERRLAEFVAGTSLDDVGEDTRTVARRILLTVLGTAIAGWREPGVQAALSVYGDSISEAGGATVLVDGRRIPAANAAAVNGLMCRALDYCDAMAPGLHIGSSLVPAALAAAELQGECTGRGFLEALVVGGEVAARMNLDEAAYAGLDPTGVAGVFGATAAASRLLGLTAAQTLHALALAFNRCGASFQSNIDGSLAVRMIQGWVAADGLACARLAKAGITGPTRFVEGVYGYGRLYAHDPAFGSWATEGLGTEYRLHDTVFKKYPSCGLTQGVTELVLGLVREHRLPADDVGTVTVRLPPYAHRLVGHPFEIGDNPRVDAQFSARYCVANAWLRGRSTLAQFEPQAVLDPALRAWARRVDVVAVPAMASRHHTAVDLEVRLADGRVLQAGLEVAPGFPGNPLSDAAHVERFAACIDYAGPQWSAARGRGLLEAAMAVETLGDVRQLITLSTRAG